MTEAAAVPDAAARAARPLGGAELDALEQHLEHRESLCPLSPSLPVPARAARLTTVACAVQNYPDWLPFDGVAANLLYRFTIKL